MNRVAMIAAVVGLSAAPAFAATPGNTQPAANPPVQQSAVRQPAPSSQQQIDRRQAALDRQQEHLDKQQTALDQQQSQQGQAQQQAHNQNDSSMNDREAQKTAINQQNWNGNGQAGIRQSAYQQREHAMDLRANRATKALNMLEANGFTQFTDFHRIHNGLFGVRVDQGGRWMTVQVNPLYNQIMRG